MKKIALMLVMGALLGSTALFAQSGIGLYGIGARLGYIMPEDPIESTLGFGAHVDLGTIMPNLTLHGYVDYWSKSYDELDYVESSFSLLGITAVAKYHFNVAGNIKPYAGGGLGLNIGSAEAKYTGPYSDLVGNSESSSSDSELGLNLVGGAAMELSPTLDGFAEARYNTGGVDYLGLYIGVTYKLK